MDLTLTAAFRMGKKRYKYNEILITALTMKYLNVSPESTHCREGVRPRIISAINRGQLHILYIILEKRLSI